MSLPKSAQKKWDQIDKTRARRAFSAAAKSYDANAQLQRVIANELADRLQYIRIKPRTILDIGVGTGFLQKALQPVFPEANYIALDFALPMLQKLKSKPSKLKGFARLWSPSDLHYPKRVYPLCADGEQLPIADASIDLVVSNLTLQWFNALDLSFRGIRRIVADKGLFMFSTFGPETLTEIRQVFTKIDGHRHVHDFVDMHTLGDMLFAGGFSDVVMDEDQHVNYFASLREMLLSIKHIGATNAHSGQTRGLMTPRKLACAEKLFEVHRKQDGLPLTYETIYGHGWVFRNNAPRVAFTPVSSNI